MKKIIVIITLNICIMLNLNSTQFYVRINDSIHMDSNNNSRFLLDNGVINNDIFSINGYNDLYKFPSTFNNTYRTATAEEININNGEFTMYDRTYYNGSSLYGHGNRIMLDENGTLFSVPFIENENFEISVDLLFTPRSTNVFYGANARISIGELLVQYNLHTPERITFSGNTITSLPNCSTLYNCYNNYKIIYENGVKSFYINDNLINQVTESITTRNVPIMISSTYAHTSSKNFQFRRYTN